MGYVSNRASFNAHKYAKMFFLKINHQYVVHTTYRNFN